MSQPSGQTSTTSTSGPAPAAPSGIPTAPPPGISPEVWQVMQDLNRPISSVTDEEVEDTLAEELALGLITSEMADEVRDEMRRGL